MEKKSYTLKECRVFNQKKFELTTKFMNGNFQNAECKELVLPDEAHPWNILHAVMEQYYKRECERAQVVDMARCDLKRAKELMDADKERDRVYWQMQKEIGDLRRDNEHLKAELSLTEESPQGQPKALIELIDYYGLGGLIDGMGGILDGLIMAFDYSGSDGLKEPMVYARALQRFFMQLEKESN